MVAEMKNALSKGNATLLLKAMHEKSKIERQNQESSKEYLGAVQNFSSKVDSLKVNHVARNTDSENAANIVDLDKENTQLQQKKVERDTLVEQIKRTTDPVARSQLQNQLDALKSVTDNMEAGVAAKRSVLNASSTAGAGKQ